MNRFFAIVCASVCLFSACAKNERDQRVSSVTPSSSSAQTTLRAARHRAADHEVVVFLGEDYANRPLVLESLISEYGIMGEGGMVTVLRYPDSLKVNGAIRFSALSEQVNKPGVTAVVAIGGPDGTVRELSKIRAANPSIRVVSLFSYEDSLSVEAASDIAVDVPAPVDALANESAATSPLDDTALGVLVLASVLAADGSREAAPLDALSGAVVNADALLKLKNSAPKMCFAPWVDVDTGLKSRNHLVLVVSGVVQNE